jgi:hypothetical protein
LEAIGDRRTQLLQELEDALEERDIAQERFEAAIGTGTEMRAYQRLRRATRRLSVAHRAAQDVSAEELETLHA